MARVFRAPRWTAVRTQKEAAVRTTEGGPGRSEPVCETASRRLGDYRCMRLGAYCAQRIYAGPGIAPSDGRNRSCADRWGRVSLAMAMWFWFELRANDRLGTPTRYGPISRRPSK